MDEEVGVQVVHGKWGVLWTGRGGACYPRNGVFGGHVWIVVLVVHGMGRFCGQVDGRAEAVRAAGPFCRFLQNDYL